MTTSGNTDEASGRVTVSTRIARAGLDEIDAIAAAEQRTRSQMVRILLAEAVASRRSRRRL